MKSYLVIATLVMVHTMDTTPEHYTILSERLVTVLLMVLDVDMYVAVYLL
jgi:hypothetical protein